MTIRVLVVDDSATMRAMIRAVVERDPELVVVGEASDPNEARQAIKALNPDVLTLDVEMPGMNGLDFLDRLMRLRPMPVVMVSTLTGNGSWAALEALEIGAVDCVSKTGAPDAPPLAGLVDKLRGAALSRPRPRPRSAPTAASTVPPAAAAAGFVPDGRVVVIGASTGGVDALCTVLSGFPDNCPPTLVTQHMPPGFTRSFAQRLDRLCRATVSEAEDGMRLAPGRIVIAPGGRHLELAGTARAPRCQLGTAPPANGHRPSVDVLFTSAARIAGPDAVGVILTGMGRDGAAGLLAMRQAGADTIGQDEHTSVVFGMPRVAAAIGAVGIQLPLDRIGGRILRITHRRSAEESRSCPSHAP